MFSFDFISCAAFQIVSSPMVQPYDGLLHNSKAESLSHPDTDLSTDISDVENVDSSYQPDKIHSYLPGCEISEDCLGDHQRSLSLSALTSKTDKNCHLFSLLDCEHVPPKDCDNSSTSQPTNLLPGEFNFNCLLDSINLKISSFVEHRATLHVLKSTN